MEDFREPWHCWQMMKRGKLLLGCVQFLHWKTQLTGGILGKKTSGLQRLFQTVVLNFSLERENSVPLISAVHKQSCVSLRQDRYYLEDNYIYPCNPSTDNNNVMLNLLSAMKQMQLSLKPFLLAVFEDALAEHKRLK